MPLKEAAPEEQEEPREELSANTTHAEAEARDMRQRLQEMMDTQYSVMSRNERAEAENIIENIKRFENGPRTDLIDDFVDRGRRLINEINQNERQYDPGIQRDFIPSATAIINDLEEVLGQNSRYIRSSERRYIRETIENLRSDPDNPETRREAQKYLVRIGEVTSSRRDRSSDIQRRF